MVMLEAARHQQNRFAIAVLFSVHAVSSFIAAYWAWCLVTASDARYAKATEAGRLLAGGWLAVALLGLSSLHSRDLHLVPDSALFGLIAVAAATSILGTGYTKYVEARNTRDEPNAAEVSALATHQAAERVPAEPSHRSAFQAVQLVV